MPGYIDRVAGEIASLLAREGLDYLQTKAVFQAARLTLEEELRFIDQAYAIGGQTGLMMQTLLETGARVSEFVALRVEDISLAERVVTIVDGKGGKRREVPIRPDLARLLAMQIGKRRAGPLFPSREKGGGAQPHVYSRQRIGQIVRQVADAAGIAKRLYPHLLRHTMATKLLALGLDITDVQRFLGHESIATTCIYAETSAALLQEIAAAHGAAAATFASDLLQGRQ